MNFTTIICCFVLLPYFASLVSPPQEAITCNAVGPNRECIPRILDCVRPRKKREVQGDSSSEEEPEKIDVDIDDLPNKYFHQYLDHYRYTDATLWRQRYLVYGKHYQGNGIIFIWLGQDTEIASNPMQTGGLKEYAEKANALFVGIELRSYSKDFPEEREADKNLKYYDTEQALADVAWFIYNFRDVEGDFDLPEKLKWVAYGTGLQGSLATWLRMKFPHLIHATLAIGAPLLAQVEFNEFFKLIDTKMLALDQPLRTKIKEAYDAIKKKLEKKPDTQKKIQKYNKELGELFKFCNVSILDDEEHIEKNLKFMYMTFAETVSSLMRFGNDYRKNINSIVKDIMMGNDDRYRRLTIIERFILLVRKVAREREIECIQIDYVKAVNVYQKFTKEKLVFPLQEKFGNRATLFQYCTEFGQFETFQHFLGTKVDLNYYMEFCHGVFGELSTKEVLERGVRKTNIFYGGLNIKVSRVVFVYGENDPYRILGVYYKTPKKSVHLVLEEARHGGDLKYLTTSPNYLNVLEDIQTELTNWLKLPGDIEHQVTGRVIRINENVENKTKMEKTENKRNTELIENNDNVGN